MKNNFPIAYFITFTCYGTWLHGIKETSVDRHHNTFGQPFMTRNLVRGNAIQNHLLDKPYLMNASQRKIALNVISDTCLQYKWDLLAAHVRSNHIHLVLNADTAAPEFVMNRLKACISRELNKVEGSIKRWTRHGSTIYLWRAENVVSAVDYVVYRQGEAMEVYLSDRFGKQSRD